MIQGRKRQRDKPSILLIIDNNLMVITEDVGREIGRTEDGNEGVYSSWWKTKI